MATGPWGQRWQQDSRATGGVTVSRSDTRTLACEQCGAILAFSPGAQELECRYCGHRNQIPEQPTVSVVELDLGPTLGRLAGESLDARPIALKCRQCGADFELKPHHHAGPCPFCNTPNVADPAERRNIAPQAVLPFLIAEPEGRKLIADWLGSLWFAPSKLAREARGSGRLEGLYVPFWTFDAGTRTRYTGQRGDVYYVTQYVETVVNGRRVQQAIQVPRIRWTPTAGQVARDFDDVLVVAGQDLPPHLVDRLEPWDLHGLKPYGADYLMGFAAELYRVPVESGFKAAEAKMRAVIEGDVRIDIGGDQQRIDQLAIEVRQPTYKHVLLPVWAAGFKFLGTDYRLIVNGRTGEVHGERPWSVWKILSAVLLALIALGLFTLLTGGLEDFIAQPGSFPEFDVPSWRY